MAGTVSRLPKEYPMWPCSLAILLVTQMLHAAEFTLVSLSAEVDTIVAEVQAVSSKAEAEEFINAHMHPAMIKRLRDGGYLDALASVLVGKNEIKSAQIQSLKNLDFKRVAINAELQTMSVPLQVMPGENADFVLIDTKWFIVN